MVVLLLCFTHAKMVNHSPVFIISLSSSPLLPDNYFIVFFSFTLNSYLLPHPHINGSSCFFTFSAPPQIWGKFPKTPTTTTSYSFASMLINFLFSPMPWRKVSLPLARAGLHICALQLILSPIHWSCFSSSTINFSLSIFSFQIKKYAIGPPSVPFCGSETRK